MSVTTGMYDSHTFVDYDPYDIEDDSIAYSGGLHDKDGMPLFVGDTVIVELSPGDPDSFEFVEIEWVKVESGFIGGITRYGSDWAEKANTVERV